MSRYSPSREGWRALDMYAYDRQNRPMPKRANLQRKSFFVDARALTRARRLLRVSTDAEAIRLSLERVAEMERFAAFMVTSRRKLVPGSIERP
jgi:hypothetical protein